MFREGRPRFWISGYDTAHLAVPVLLVLVVAALAFAPAPQPAPARPAAPVARAMAPTLIIAPVTGSVLITGQSFFVDGSAEPGSNVRLFYFANGADYPLGDARVGADGRWRFTINDLKPGNHSFRAAAFLAGRTMISGEVTYTVKAAPRQPARQRRR